jgi:hypothetical protein
MVDVEHGGVVGERLQLHGKHDRATSEPQVGLGSHP